MDRKLLFVVLLGFAILVSSCARSSLPNVSPNNLASCRLSPRGSHWVGGCGPMFDGSPVFEIARADSIKTGVWRRDVHPTSVWSGAMIDKDSPDWLLEIEIYDGGNGIVRSAYGWYAVSGFSFADSLLRFRVDTLATVPPSPLDKEILVRASQILSSDAVWNRADNRECPRSATTWSIYCALELAEIELAGGFNHRRPAAQLVRAIVDRRSVGRGYSHRLMDYNNDPATKLADVKSLFAEALQGATAGR